MSSADRFKTLLELESRAMAADDVPALRFTIVNASFALCAYRQAVMFESAGGKLRLVAASGLASVAEDSPFTVWVSQFVRRLPADAQPVRLAYADAAEEDQVGWAEWLPEHLLWAPLADLSGGVHGHVLYAAERPWSDQSVALLQRLHQVHALCLARLRAQGSRRWLRRLSLGLRGRLAVVSLLFVLACVFVPVRMSALAPAEVSALTAVAITAAQDGVVATVDVLPNSRVSAGDVLFRLDDSNQQSRLAIARQALEVARADEHVAQQRAFGEQQSRAELAALAGRVREREIELAAVQAQLERLEVRAPSPGVVVFTDPNDWIGRPVQTGERVMQLAQPEDAGLLIWLPVADAINLNAGAAVRLFLHTDPLNPQNARLFEASYQVVINPEGLASYRLRARFDQDAALPRIGLRGTARIAGEQVSLGYYLFRRPIAAVRAWTGW